MLRLIRRLYRLFIDTTLARYGTLPTSADTVAAAAVTLTAAAGAWTFGAYAQVAATVGAADVWLIGYTLENFVGAASQGEVSIARGAGGAEVELSRIQSVVAGMAWFPAPLYVPAGTRVAARYRTSTGAADTVDVKLVTATGI